MTQPISNVPEHFVRAVAAPAGDSAFGVPPWRVTDVYQMAGIFACLRDGNGFITAQLPWEQANELCAMLNARAGG